MPTEAPTNDVDEEANHEMENVASIDSINLFDSSNDVDSNISSMATSSIPGPINHEAVRNERFNNIILWFTCFLVLWASLNKISDKSVNQLVIGLNRLIKLLGYEKRITKKQNENFTFFSTMKRMKKKLNVGSNFTVFTQCSHKKCGQLYDTNRLFTKNLLHGNYHYELIQTFCSNTEAHAQPHPLIVNIRLNKFGTNKQNNSYNESNPIYRPILNYCYYGIERGLRQLFKIPHFDLLLSHWKNRGDNNHTSTYFDIYDGSMWKTWMDDTNSQSNPLQISLAFSLNMDWFQPYKVDKKFLY